MPLGHPGALSRRPLSVILEQPLVATIAAGAGAVLIYTAEIIPATGSAVYVATEQYNTLVSDSRPSIPFNATMEHAPRFKRSIKSGDGFGKMSSGFGDLTIANASGEYDTLISNPLDGARVVCKLGWRGISYDRFITIFDGQVETADITEASFVLHFKDDNKRLDIPAQPNVYGGTGGIDGDSNVKGKRKQLVIGPALNVSLLLIDAPNLVFAGHDGQMTGFSHLYDRGVELAVNATADYANYAALIGTTITAGRWASCNALGVVRLGAKPDGAITATFSGGAVSNGLVAGSPISGTALTDTASAIHYLISNSAANIVVDAASILAVKAAQPASISYVIGPDDNKTLAQAIDELTGGIGGYAGFRADRSFNIGIFTLPVGAVVGDYTNKDWYNELQRPQLPKIAAVPPSRFFAACSHNFTQQPDLDATVDAGTLTLRKDPYLIVTSNDATTTAAILAAHKSATDSGIIITWFVNPSEAIDECNRRLTLYGGAVRSLYRVDLTEIAFALDVGMVMKITDGRFSLSGGKSLTVVEIDNGYDDGVVSVEGFG